MYIGRTIRPVHDRFQRHISDALNNRLDTYFARAIRKYGPDNFVCEIIDTAETEEELNKKEEMWIKYYDSVRNGYNTSQGGFACGGNTYYGIEDLTPVKKKLSLSKKGGKNPMSRKVIAIDTLTCNCVIYNSQQEAADALGLSSHMPVSRRCRQRGLPLVNGRYDFEYYNDEGVTTTESICE